IRGVPAPRIPGMRLPQRLAASLIAATILAGGAPAMAAPTHIPAPPPPAVSTIDRAPDTALPRQSVITIKIPPSGTSTAPSIGVNNAPGSAAASGPVTGPVAASDGEFVYRVRRGDHLGSIAQRFLGSFNDYPRIAALNRGLIPDNSGPHGPD